MTIYHITIDNGILQYDYFPAPRVANEYHAHNAKQYFAFRGKTKPAAIPVRGWPFSKMYLTHGNDENGSAVAWTKPKNPYYD